MKRRVFLLTVLAFPVLSRADPKEEQDAIAKVIGNAKPNKGKVTLELPQLVENGNTVSMSVKVDSPMTEKEYVKAIHVFTEKNPQPYVASFHLGPRAGRALVATRIRLADSQTGRTRSPNCGGLSACPPQGSACHQFSFRGSTVPDRVVSGPGVAFF